MKSLNSSTRLIRTGWRKFFQWFSYFLLIASCIFVVYSCGVEKPEEIKKVEAELPEKIDFNLHVKPILSDNCFFCHGPDKAKQKAGLRLDIRENALSALKESPNKQAIAPGDLSESEVYHRIISDDPDIRMPPVESNLSLSAYEKAVLTSWIEQGAEYKPHWAFIPPKKHTPPEIKKEGIQPQNPIDSFIFSKLDEKGLQPNKQADKETLIRRVTFDLTGLPPTISEINSFLRDTSDRAYEKVVDRLLASSHYGEKMAAHWLDVSRYADTHGYSVDRYRPMWPWRDWVIKAFNKNMPFDQFTTWQLAGDLLPDPSREQILATAFNRNHAQNMEGGIVNEEFRVEYVIDRTNTLGKAFMGMTVECAQCHDHKYDPISHKNYYQLFSFFNNVDEAGQISWDNAMPVPTLMLTDEKQDSIISYLSAQIDSVQTGIRKVTKRKKEDFEQWQQTNPLLTASDFSDDLQAYFPLDAFEGDTTVSSGTPARKAGIPELRQVEGKFGKALYLNGDEPLELGDVGIFSRANPFSVGLWINIPEKTKDGVIFHKGKGAILYNFRGYHLALRNNKLEVLMAHTAPYNNISKVTSNETPKEQWIHVMLTYDGSSKANGLKLYINGKKADMLTEKDNLYKDILFPSLGEEPGLKIGARWRGTGFKNGLVDELMVFERRLTDVEVAFIAENGLRDTGQINITSSGLNGYYPSYLANHSPSYRESLRKLESLREKKHGVTEQVQEIMVMQEMDTLRPAYVLNRGVYNNYGERVYPGTPERILAFPDSLPKNRLGLAKWLTHPKNPLTSRVIVNRYWKNYFGRGLVKSVSDFGNQGDLPSHPELLDWLAVAFRESGWDIKAMQKRIVMSATYRQSSRAGKKLHQTDPDNVLLARGPSRRLTAEMLRDNALAASNLLVDKIGGPSVKPYQPDGLWTFNGGTYKQDHGEKLYRRSLYTFWKRTVPPPAMNNFDAPTRSYCVVQRQETSTPLQALNLLNDPQFVEASKMIAQRVMKQKKALEEQLTLTYRLLTSRTLDKEELDILKDLFEGEKMRFRKQPLKMKGWLEAGETTVDRNMDLTTLAAHTVVASTVMNSDGAIIKR